MFSDVQFRMRALLRRSAMEAELDDELRAHLEHQAEKYIRSGLTPEEAEKRAQFDFGDLAQIKEECRDSWGVRFVDELAAGAHSGLRQIRSNPGFAAVAVMALVLGVLANAAVFSDMSTVVGRLAPRQNSVHPVLAARNSVPPPVRSNNVSSGFPAKKLHNHPVRRTRAPGRSHKTELAGLRRPSYLSVTVVTVGDFSVPAAAGMPGAAWAPDGGEYSVGRFATISETGRQTQGGFSQVTLGMAFYFSNASYTVMEVVTNNPENPQAGEWRFLTLKASAAMSNAVQRDALTAIQRRGQRTSASKGLSKL